MFKHLKTNATRLAFGLMIYGTIDSFSGILSNNYRQSSDGFEILVISFVAYTFGITLASIQKDIYNRRHRHNYDYSKL